MSAGGDENGKRKLQFLSILLFFRPEADGLGRLL